MRRCLIFSWMMLCFAAGRAFAQPAETRLHVYQPPPIRWDHNVLSFRSALQQTPTDFAILTGGVAFGKSAAEINAFLPDPLPGLVWNGLPIANEYAGEVRYFGVPFDSTGPLRMDTEACTGSASYIVFLFSGRGLFRVSYRLIADKNCPDTTEAARQIFGRYVPIGPGVALSVRYHTGTTEVVDITDPTAGYLIPTRWRQGIN